jgi:hypothetical protein
MKVEISVDVYNTRPPESHSMVLDLLHVNGWKSGTDTDTEKIPGAVLLQFNAILPRRGPLAYLKTRVCPYD